jgi:hypothetical protein
MENSELIQILGLIYCLTLILSLNWVLCFPFRYLKCHKYLSSQTFIISWPSISLGLRALCKFICYLLYSFTNIILLVSLLTNKMLPRTVLTTPLFLVGPTHGDRPWFDRWHMTYQRHAKKNLAVLHCNFKKKETVWRLLLLQVSFGGPLF